MDSIVYCIVHYCTVGLYLTIISRDLCTVQVSTNTLHILKISWQVYFVLTTSPAKNGRMYKTVTIGSYRINLILPYKLQWQNQKIKSLKFRYFNYKTECKFVWANLYWIDGNPSIFLYNIHRRSINYSLVIYNYNSTYNTYTWKAIKQKKYKSTVIKQ